MLQRRLTAKEFARELRKTPTPEEHWLWQYLRGRRLGGHRFRRQVSIGPYFADLVCLERMLIVELDGGQHGRQVERDEKRTRFLAGEGFEVLRFWNPDVHTQRAAVLETILQALERRPSVRRAAHARAS